MSIKAEEKLTPEQLVKQKFPDAFVDDDGDWIYVRNKITVTGPCPDCGQKWIHKVTDFSSIGILGTGNCNYNAWQDAAKKLGLL